MSEPSDEGRVRAANRSWTLRAPLLEDFAWVIGRHRDFYRREHGWDDRFMNLVEQVVADFVRDFDPARERCWIADLGGRPVGSVFLVAHPERAGVAKLRLLLVEPEARGLGIGAGLVAECTAFARATGYRAITLWTSSVLHGARRIYEAEGYRLVREAPEPMFNEAELGQEWELEL
ncbi:MAG TPA: GNAT family N-acetyltransferase [Gemmatimonadota bacterium]|nr:GNAT family N-acetyltransferase [Gemmatimonadota bacterium]